MHSKGIMVNSFVAGFIIDYQWSFPTDWDLWFPFLHTLLLVVPNNSILLQDQLVWENNVIGLYLANKLIFVRMVMLLISVG